MNMELSKVLLTLRSGLFLFVAPSKDKFPRAAGILEPMSTLKLSLPDFVIIPITLSPFVGTY